MGSDSVSPLKPHLGKWSQSLADRLRAVIETSYHVLPGRDGDYFLHKLADQIRCRVGGVSHYGLDAQVCLSHAAINFGATS